MKINHVRANSCACGFGGAPCSLARVIQRDASPASKNHAHAAPANRVLMLANAHMRQGRHARAVQLMQDALKTQDSAEFRTALGLSLLQTGQTSMASDQLERAYKADPRQTYAGLALVNIHLRERQMNKALSVADGLARAQPNNATVLMVQAYAKAQARDYTGARVGYEKALKLDPKLLEATLGLARLVAQRARHLNVLLDQQDRRLLGFELAQRGDQVDEIGG